MYASLVTGLLLIVALIHLLPSVGFLSTSRLTALYDIEVRGPDLEVLLRHRALLFGVLGVFFGYAAFIPVHQPVAFCAAAVSIGSFLFLTSAVGGYNAALHKVVIADVVAAVCLAAAVVFYWLGTGSTRG